ncbi:16S rRNA (cytosine967-C5)-methyltransferase [Devosia enhydra]|uniref:16S rRNA (Cytosine967-C5)-methyltransferase n=1 Tax=Devosia enhydra TaxID=665118 RepID=A0A1K2HUG9_9HYPH|nr:RsmB/NOP family class I SAM-dependent RNA methyltransferase [Devosia enhydra]SFZ81721.1 16S rRNA (cytosine967-C5)-methyltransferase [Devosia enhydra]
MRLPGRMAAAIAVLEDIESHRRPVAEALKAWGLANRFAGAGDRAAIGNLVYDGLRRKRSHGWAMQSEAARALVLSVVVREWGESPESLATLFADDPHAPAALSPDEVARLSATDPLAGAPAAVVADLPDWIAALLEISLGHDWIVEGQGLTGRPPLDLRANLLKSDRARVMKALSRFSPQEGPTSPWGLRLAAGPRDARTPNVLTDEAWLKGWVEVQDQGSQVVSLLCGVQPGEQVLDLCAGAGGKTLALAALMGNKGQIFAHDSDRTRLAPIYDRLKRAGVRNVQVRPPAETALDDLVGRMDRVVVDAPCTGSGTWRRQPHAKWKLTPEQLALRVAEQQQILDDAARFVKPGGSLAYITCSVLPDENGAQAQAFLARHPEFRVVPGHGLWHKAFGGSGARARFTAEGGILLTPATTGTDGFYIARFERAQ